VGIAEEAQVPPVPRICAAHPSFKSIIPAIALEYAQTAFSDINSCLIDEYFTADFQLDGLNGYSQNQLIPWLEQFFGCADARPVIFPPGQFSAIGLVPAASPPSTITATDYAAIISEFLTAFAASVTSGASEGQCIFEYVNQEEVARVNAMLYEMAPTVINDGDRGLTHSDPLGPDTCPAYDPPFNVWTACTPP
jgi:hypothetical protein